MHWGRAELCHSKPAIRKSAGGGGQNYANNDPANNVNTCSSERLPYIKNTLHTVKMCILACIMLWCASLFMPNKSITVYAETYTNSNGVEFSYSNGYMTLRSADATTVPNPWTDIKHKDGDQDIYDWRGSEYKNKVTHVYISCPKATYINSGLWSDAPNIKYVEIENYDSNTFGYSEKMTGMYLDKIQGEFTFNMSAPRNGKITNSPNFSNSKVREAYLYNYNGDFEVGSFSGCKELVYVYLNKVTVIPENCFKNCEKLKYVYIKDKDNKDVNTVETIESNAFYRAGVTVNDNGTLSFNSTPFYIFPSQSVKTVGDYAFEEANISTFKFDSVTSLGRSCFKDSKLACEVTFKSKHMTVIPDYAFYNTGITKVNFAATEISGTDEDGNAIKVDSKSVTTIGAYAFYGCTKLTTKDAFDFESIGPNLTSVGTQALKFGGLSTEGTTAGKPTLEVSQSIEKVEPYYTTDGLSGGIGKVTVVAKAKDAKSEEGQDYVLCLDVTGSMRDSGYCTKCGTIRNLGNSDGTYRTHNCKQGGIFYSKWDAAKIACKNLVNDIFDNNSKNRVCLVTFRGGGYINYDYTNASGRQGFLSKIDSLKINNSNSGYTVASGGGGTSWRAGLMTSLRAAASRGASSRLDGKYGACGNADKPISLIYVCDGEPTGYKNFIKPLGLCCNAMFDNVFAVGIMVAEEHAGRPDYADTMQYFTDIASTLNGKLQHHEVPGIDLHLKLDEILKDIAFYTFASVRDATVESTINNNFSLYDGIEWSEGVAGSGTTVKMKYNHLKSGEQYSFYYYIKMDDRTKDNTSGTNTNRNDSNASNWEEVQKEALTRCGVSGSVFGGIYDGLSVSESNTDKHSLPWKYYKITYYEFDGTVRSIDAKPLGTADDFKRNIQNLPPDQGDQSCDGWNTRTDATGTWYIPSNEKYCENLRGHGGIEQYKDNADIKLYPIKFRKWHVEYNDNRKGKNDENYIDYWDYKRNPDGIRIRRSTKGSWDAHTMLHWNTSQYGCTNIDGLVNKMENKKHACTGTVWELGSMYNKSEDIMLYMQWYWYPYVAYHPNCEEDEYTGSMGKQPFDVQNGETIKILDCGFHKYGFKFLGEWITNSGDKTATSKVYRPGDTYGDNAILHLYATWERALYLTVNPNGGTYENSTDNKVEQLNSGDTRLINIPTREGYGFMGWQQSYDTVEVPRILRVGSDRFKYIAGDYNGMGSIYALERPISVGDNKYRFDGNVTFRDSNIGKRLAELGESWHNKDSSISQIEYEDTDGEMIKAYSFLLSKEELDNRHEEIQNSRLNIGSLGMWSRTLYNEGIISKRLDDKGKEDIKRLTIGDMPSGYICVDCFNANKESSTSGSNLKFMCTRCLNTIDTCADGHVAYEYKHKGCTAYGCTAYGAGKAMEVTCKNNPEHTVIPVCNINKIRASKMREKVKSYECEIHGNTVVMDRAIPLYCSECVKTGQSLSKTFKARIKPIITYEYNGNTKYWYGLCEVCGGIQFGEYQSTIDLHDSSYGSWYECNKCGKVERMRRVRPEDADIFCAECLAEYGTEDSMKFIEKTETKAVCEECADKVMLYYACNTCGESIAENRLSYNNKLTSIRCKKHTNTVVVDETNSSYAYYCKDCSKIMNSSYYVDTFYECPECNKRYYSNYWAPDKCTNADCGYTGSFNKVVYHENNGNIHTNLVDISRSYYCPECMNTKKSNEILMYYKCNAPVNSDNYWGYGQKCEGTLMPSVYKCTANTDHPVGSLYRYTCSKHGDKQLYIVTPDTGAYVAGAKYSKENGTSIINTRAGVSDIHPIVVTGGSPHKLLRQNGEKAQVPNPKGDTVINETYNFTMGGYSVELKAIWREIVTYTIRYMGNGATSGNVEPQTFKTFSDGVVIKPNEFKRDGCKFLQWNTLELEPDDVEGLGEIYLPGDKYSKYEDIILYAQWLEVAQLKINPNTGNWGDVDTVRMGHIPKTGNKVDIDMDADDKQSVPDPDKLGYTFTGWDVKKTEAVVQGVIKLSGFNLRVTDKSNLDSILYRLDYKGKGNLSTANNKVAIYSGKLEKDTRHNWTVKDGKRVFMLDYGNIDNRSIGEYDGANGADKEFILKYKINLPDTWVKGTIKTDAINVGVPERVQFVCAHCGNSSISLVDYDVDTGIADYVCNNYNCRNHTYGIFKNDNKTPVCKECEEVLSPVNYLGTILKCESCDIYYEYMKCRSCDEYNLKINSLSLIDERIDDYEVQCKDCGAVFKIQSMQNATTPSKTYAYCSKCGKLKFNCTKCGTTWYGSRVSECPVCGRINDSECASCGRNAYYIVENDSDDLLIYCEKHGLTDRHGLTEVTTSYKFGCKHCGIGTTEPIYACGSISNRCESEKKSSIDTYSQVCSLLTPISDRCGGDNIPYYDYKCNAQYTSNGHQVHGHYINSKEESNKVYLYKCVYLDGESRPATESCGALKESDVVKSACTNDKKKYDGNKIDTSTVCLNPDPVISICEQEITRNTTNGSVTSTTCMGTKLNPIEVTTEVCSSVPQYSYSGSLRTGSICMDPTSAQRKTYAVCSDRDNPCKLDEDSGSIVKRMCEAPVKRYANGSTITNSFCSGDSFNTYKYVCEATPKRDSDGNIIKSTMCAERNSYNINSVYVAYKCEHEPEYDSNGKIISGSVCTSYSYKETCEKHGAKMVEVKANVCVDHLEKIVEKEVCTNHYEDIKDIEGKGLCKNHLQPLTMKDFCTKHNKEIIKKKICKMHAKEVKTVDNLCKNHLQPIENYERDEYKCPKHFEYCRIADLDNKKCALHNSTLEKVFICKEHLKNILVGDFCQKHKSSVNKVCNNCYNEYTYGRLDIKFHPLYTCSKCGQILSEDNLKVLRRGEQDITNNLVVNSMYNIEASADTEIHNITLFAKLIPKDSVFDAPAKLFTMGDKTTELTANYRPNTYTIHYSGNDTDTNINGDKTTTTHTGTAPNDTPATYDQDVTLANNTFTKEGYIFRGWSRDKDWKLGSTSPIYNGGQTLTKPNFTPVDKGEVTLYAVWTPINYTLIYSGNNTSVNIYGDETSETYTGTTESIQLRFDQDTIVKNNGYSKKGYKFIEWNSKSDSRWNNKGTTYTPGQSLTHPNFCNTEGGTYTLYALWEPIRYTLNFHSNDTNPLDYNNPDDIPQQVRDENNNLTAQIRYDQQFNLRDVTFRRNAPYTNTLNENIKESWGFIGWGYGTEQMEKDFSDKQKVWNFTDVENKAIHLYALWQKDMKLTFNLNGGTYQGSPNDIVLTGKVYNKTYKYTFGILNNNTPASGVEYTAQTGTIDAYGTVIDNGMNSKYVKVENGLRYRFLGWGNASDATEPMWEYSPYNPNKKNTYTEYNNTTLYAIWEPELRLSFTLDRTLGTLPFDDTYAENARTPITTLKDISAVSNGRDVPAESRPKVSAIIKPGEQGYYNIATYNNNLKVMVEFDTNMTNIYNIGDESVVWKDSLNPSTSEDLIKEPKQKHGLNRAFTVNEGVPGQAKSVQRQFYIPTYLGTDQTWYIGESMATSTSSGKGINRYAVAFYISQPSYYYQKTQGIDEEVWIDGLIYITGSKNEDVDKIPSVLDELRTELRIRIK